MGTLITVAEAERVEKARSAAPSTTARSCSPAASATAPCSPRPSSPGSTRGRPFSQDELFGPAVAVSTAADWESAIAQANGTPYGLGAGIFTADVSGAVRAIREIDAGNVHINWTPLWRADLMPYGGLKASGIGKEGPARPWPR